MDSNDNSIPIDPKRQELYRAYTNYLNNSISNRTIGDTLSYRKCVEFGRNLRDHWYHGYSILPGAITTFKDIASSRQWRILGTTRLAGLRAVSRLNNSFLVDSIGIRHEGFEQLFDRLVMDWLLVGRCMFHSYADPENEREWSPLEYIDPTYMYPIPNPDGTYWEYRPTSRLRNVENRILQQEEVFFLDNIRIGATGGVVGRVAYLLPMANLDWLMRQHDTMKLDGRKIQDLIIVQEGLGEKIEEGFLMFMALMAGNDISKNRLPVVEFDKSGSDVSTMGDLITRLGISEVPLNLSREELEGRYVREISATLGLPIGQFWNDPRGTNRSLEQVTQERSTLKGPSYFVRSFCRLLNHSVMMGRTPGNQAKLYFDEETDNSSLELHSKAMLNYAQTFVALSALDPTIVPAEDIWGIFLKKGLLEPNVLMKDIVTYEEDTLGRSVDESLGKGQVILDLDENVIAERPSFQVGWNSPMKGFRRNETT